MCLDRCNEGHGLQPGQHHVLMAIHRLTQDGQPFSQKDIARRLNITPAAVTVTLKKMEKKGMVEKTVNDKDNRYNQISLTEKGRQIVADSEKTFRYINRQTFQGFTDEELSTLDGYLRRIQQNLDNAEDSGAEDPAPCGKKQAERRAAHL